MKRRALAVCAGLVLLGLMPGAVQALVPAGLDQSNDPNLDNQHTLGSQADLAQTFTAGKSGLLSGVDLYMNGGNAPISVTIEGTSSGHPDGNVMATSGTGTPPSAANWVPFSFANPPSVTAGTMYAIVFNTGGSNAIWGSENTYPGGQALVANGASWITHAFLSSPGDYAFQTFVEAVQLTWDKAQIVAGATTQLTLTETMSFAAGSAANHYLLDLDGWPTWFTASGITCSPQITNCTISDFENLGVTAPNSGALTLVVSVTGPAAPPSSAGGTQVGANAYACLVAAAPDAQVVPNQSEPGCAEGFASLAIGAFQATLAPTSTSVQPGANEPGSVIWLLPFASIGFLGGLLVLTTRRRRRSS